MITVLCDVGALEKNKTSKQTDKIIKKISKFYPKNKINIFWVKS